MPVVWLIATVCFSLTYEFLVRDGDDLLTAILETVEDSSSLCDQGTDTANTSVVHQTYGVERHHLWLVTSSASAVLQETARALFVCGQLPSSLPLRRLLLQIEMRLVGCAEDVLHF